MLKQIWKRIGQVFIMIKRILTLRVVFDNILGAQKYKKETKIMEPKRLYKSKTNRVICGVCGGIGEYFGIDPTIVRHSWL